MSSFTKLKQGDFITYTNKPGTFGIYEGIPANKNNNCFKNYSLALFFDPSKYQQTTNGFKQVPSLEISSETTQCTKTIDTEWENYWWTKLTSVQKAEAEEKLKEFGYKFDEETLTLVAIDTGEIIYKIKDNRPPKPKYEGELVKPITQELKDKLKESIKTPKISRTCGEDYQRNYWGEEYQRGYWGEDIGDWYD